MKEDGTVWPLDRNGKPMPFPDCSCAWAFPLNLRDTDDDNEDGRPDLKGYFKNLNRCRCPDNDNRGVNQANKNGYKYIYDTDFCNNGDCRWYKSGKPTFYNGNAPPEGLE